MGINKRKADWEEYMLITSLTFQTLLINTQITVSQKSKKALKAVNWCRNISIIAINFRFLVYKVGDGLQTKRLRFDCGN